MSKYSGIFLSFLLIFLCLWINICRYPRIWTMVNGTEKAEKRDDSLRQNDPELNDPKLEETLETKADHLFPDVSEEPDAWVPKPVKITVNNGVNGSGEYYGDDDFDGFAGHNVSGGRNPNFFQTANLSSPLDEDADDASGSEESEKDSEADKNVPRNESEGNEENSSKNSTPNGPSYDGSSGNVQNPTEGDSAGEDGERRSGNSGQPNEDDGNSAAATLRIHSSYLAASSPETSPLDSESPSYEIGEKTPFSCSQTNAKGVERAL